MGKVTGFLEFQRLQEASEAPQLRKKHYKEFTMHLSDADAKVQGAVEAWRARQTAAVGKVPVDEPSK